ncbi:MAG: TrkA family potassium uptake protein [Blastocatellia bacterium]|nr:TrkA family potassium uptake protein [Blastocatellia bacterium]
MRRKLFAVIGLGHFGAHAARTLYTLGKEVIAIDLDSEAVQTAADFATHAIVADATERHTLEALGVAEVDAAIISLGGRMDVITLAALHVKEMGVPYIAVKALSEEHGRILTALGIHDVVHPEKDRAIRLANSLARRDVIDFLPLLPGYSIIEVKAPAEFVGKSLNELALRNELRVQLVAIQSGRGDRQHINIIPRADDVIHEDDLLVLVGEDSDLDHIREIGQ